MWTLWCLPPFMNFLRNIIDQSSQRLILSLALVCARTGKKKFPDITPVRN
jgi:hypothetical protein